ncbi:uncharacterized protein AAEQ78_014352 isoform 1-T1 [Lycaon pictus]
MAGLRAHTSPPGAPGFAAGAPGRARRKPLRAVPALLGRTRRTGPLGGRDERRRPEGPRGRGARGGTLLPRSPAVRVTRASLALTPGGPLRSQGLGFPLRGGARADPDAGRVPPGGSAASRLDAPLRPRPTFAGNQSGPRRRRASQLPGRRGSGAHPAEGGCQGDQGSGRGPSPGPPRGLGRDLEVRDSPGSSPRSPRGTASGTGSGAAEVRRPRRDLPGLRSCNPGDRTEKPNSLGERARPGSKPDLIPRSKFNLLVVD